MFLADGTVGENWAIFQGSCFECWRLIPLDANGYALKDSLRSVEALYALSLSTTEALLGYDLPMAQLPQPQLFEFLMDEALNEARCAQAAGEVPVGAVVWRAGEIIGRGRNTAERDAHVVTHAELHAITEASKRLGDWRLTESVLCVTLEPCTMCLGAIRLSRIPIVVFGTGDSKQGAIGSLYDLSQDARLGPPPRVIHNIRKEACEELLKEFFKTLRT
jgi:tRNA(adenine34) deaminase